MREVARLYEIAAGEVTCRCGWSSPHGVIELTPCPDHGWQHAVETSCPGCAADLAITLPRSPNRAERRRRDR